MNESDLILNPAVIPNLAIGFVRGMDFDGDAIALVRGGIKAMNDPSFPTHALLFVWWEGQLFVAEETSQGLVLNPSVDYMGRKNIRIVGVYYCHCWDWPQNVDTAMKQLAYIMEQRGNRKTATGKYNFWLLGKFLPLVRNWPVVKRAVQSTANICSENVTIIHIDQGGCSWLLDRCPAPDQLMAIVQRREKTVDDVNCVLDYYVGGGRS
jgi:hypothetical protein